MGRSILITKTSIGKEMLPTLAQASVAGENRVANTLAAQSTARLRADRISLDNAMEKLPRVNRNRAPNKRPSTELDIDPELQRQHNAMRREKKHTKREGSDSSLSSSKLTLDVNSHTDSIANSKPTRRINPDSDRVGAATPVRSDRLEQEEEESINASTRKDMTLVQDSVKRMGEFMNKVDQLQRAGNLTTLELQSFRQEYQRQIDAILAKLDAISSRDTQRSPHSPSRVTDAEIVQLRDELAICKDELIEMEPRRASIENEFFERMEHFSTQLDHVRLQMSKMEQDLLQENDVIRRTLQNQLARQMNQFRQAQGGENKRLRDEMDELRSDMCEILKEMHLLKERTKYLGREARGGGGRTQPAVRQSNVSYNRFPDTLRHSTNLPQPNLYSSACSSHLCSRVPQQYDDRVQVHNHDDLYCQHHHCPAGIPHGEPIEHIPSRQPSPPRLTQSALMQATAAAAAAAAARPSSEHHDLRRFCPSPHYSSRSSSVSGRISATREENVAVDEHVDDPASERRLLEQHRLFWIGEGAGSISQLSMELPNSKFADDEGDEVA